MKLIKAVVRPDKVEPVKDALGRLGITGLTATEVRGHGKQKGHTAIYRGTEYSSSLLPKVNLEVIVADTIVEDVIRAIVEAAKTGATGDGRIFVLPMAQSYKIRTGEKDVS